MLGDDRRPQQAITVDEHQQVRLGFAGGAVSRRGGAKPFVRLPHVAQRRAQAIAPGGHHRGSAGIRAVVSDDHLFRQRGLACHAVQHAIQRRRPVIGREDQRDAGHRDALPMPAAMDEIGARLN
ncbi:MAG: hypothetical protein ABIP08_07820 [Lautropia sp.]